MDWTWGWLAVQAIGTWALVLGVVIAFLQVRQARKSTNAQIAMELFRELRDEKAIEKLRSIYEIESNVRYLSKNQQINADYILDRLDTLGNLVKMEIIDRKLAIETYGGPPALRFWYKLKHYITEMQKVRGYFGENFEGFVRISLDYFNENRITINYYKFGEEDKPINLTTELKESKFLPRSWEELEKEHKNKK